MFVLPDSVAIDDEADAVAHVDERVEHGQVTLAGHAVDALDAVNDELVDENAGTGA